MLCGLLLPTAGDATVCGFVPWKERKSLSYKIGCVFGQRSALWDGIPVRKSYELLRDIYSLDEQAFKGALDPCIEIFELSPLLTKAPRELSLGERMRCDITASLLHNPALLFLDEPSIGLDIESRLALRGLLRAVCSERSVTVLLTSHDTGDIEGVCDRVVVVNHGTILFDSTMKELKSSFMTEKLITVHTSSEARMIGANGITTRSVSTNQLTISVDTSRTSVDGVVAAILRENEVTDLLIEEKPFEEVVRDLYRLGEIA